MMKILNEYRGFRGAAVWSDPDLLWYWRIIGIKDYIDFIAEDAMLVESEFHSAVDDYIDITHRMEQKDMTDSCEDVADSRIRCFELEKPFIKSGVIKSDNY